MIFKRNCFCFFVALSLFFFILGGCVRMVPPKIEKIPITLDTSFSEMGITTISLLPVVDRRPDKSYDIDFDKDIREKVKEILEKKGYSVEIEDTFSAEIDNEELAEMDVADLASLGPEDARAVLLIYIEDILSKYVVMAYTFKIEATASLISKEKQVELWRDKGIGKSGQGGLVSIVPALFGPAGINDCINDMLDSFPNAPK